MPVRFLQGALFILVRNFGLLGSEYEYCVCPIPLSLEALKLIHEKNSRVRPHELEHFHPLVSVILRTNLADHATGFPLRSRCLHFDVFFRFLLVHATGLTVLCYSYSHFLLMRDAM